VPQVRLAEEGQMKPLHTVPAIALTLAALIVAAGAATSASAASTITRGTITTPISESGLSDDCRPGISGTLVGTDVLSFQSVETSKGFHIVAKDGGTGRIDWTDGTYTIVESIDRFSFDAVGNGTTVNTVAHEDPGDFYSADGVFQFRDTFHEVEHITVTKGDVTRVEFERGHFHLFGDC